MAWMLTETSWRFSDRFWAVTTSSSIAVVSARGARAGAVCAIALAGALGGCTYNEDLGRNQLLIVDNSQLATASQQGVKIDLIIRGACILPAQQPGVTDNIRIRSVIGRFLEHSRVFYFRVGEREELWLSSADWMNRNMLRRIELAWPVTDPVLRQRIIDECLSAYLHDTRDAWLLQPDGQYVRAQAGATPKGKAVPLHSAQQSLMHRYGSKG